MNGCLMRGVSDGRAILLPLLLVLMAQRGTAADQQILIRAERVLTMTGQVLEPGAVLVSDGKIQSVESEIEATDEVLVVEVHTLLPGLVDAYSQAGLAGGTSELSREVTPELDTNRSLDWRSRQFRELISEGTTCTNVVPGTDNVVAGFSCIVKTGGDEQARMVQPRGGLVVAVCSDPVSRNRSRTRPDSIFVRQPTNRMGVVWILRSRLQLASSALVDGLSKRDAEVNRILAEALRGEHRIFGVSRTDFDIRSLLEIGQEFGYEPVVLGGNEAYKVADLLSATGTPVVYTALTSQAARGAERTELRWNVPGKLHEAQVPFCLAGGRLLAQARFAARFGLDPQIALRAVTSIPATILGIEDRVGSIAPGRDADLLALGGDPLEFTSPVTWVMIDGKILAGEAGEAAAEPRGDE